PTVTITRDTVPNTAGWVNTPTTITVTPADADSGVARTEYRLNGGGWTPYTAPFLVPIGTTTVEARAFDNAGNESALATLTVKYDPNAPSPANEVTLVLRNAQLQTASSFRQNEVATALFSCGDAVSGIATCTIKAGLTGTPLTTLGSYTGAVTNGTVNLPTGATGTYTVELVAVDNAGNGTTRTATYTVTPAFAVCYLYDPYQPKNIGSNYTIKIRLCDPVTGANLSSRNITLTALTVNGIIDPGANFSGNSNNGYVFRWTASDRSYTYNLDTARLPAGLNTLFFTTQPVPDRNNLPPAELGALFTLQ
ncbi:MAG: chitobiase/beta-hexosaminidase C-terminal domain-containing protein, partial [Ilumatobacteraceae bacterium]|nr:chitobiase/beta-hexosaminidase C-terminal domain-containing protein [Ilumatobacteraceae bacterium]